MFTFTSLQFFEYLYVEGKQHIKAPLPRDISSNAKLKSDNIDEDAFAGMKALKTMYMDADLYNATCPGGDEAWGTM